LEKYLQNKEASTLSVHVTSRVTILSPWQVPFSLPIFSTILFLENFKLNFGHQNYASLGLRAAHTQNNEDGRSLIFIALTYS
jgi:hypothetical protein